MYLCAFRMCSSFHVFMCGIMDVLMSMSRYQCVYCCTGDFSLPLYYTDQKMEF